MGAAQNVVSARTKSRLLGVYYLNRVGSNPQRDG